MAGNHNLNCFFIVACLALLQISSAQTVYKVGDSTGWAIPSSSSFYSDWASSKSFKVGDTLEFDFTTGQHTVAEVTKSAYDSCNTGTTISLHSTGPASLTISSAGTHYYICTVGPHCSAGQKISITAAAATASAPAPSTTPKAPAPSTTPKAAAPSPKASAPSPKASAPSPKAVAPAPSETTKAAPTPSATSTPSKAPAVSPTATTPASTTLPNSPSPAGEPTSSTTTSPAPSAAPHVAAAGIFFSLVSLLVAFLF